jgi:hypothetical protein
MDCNHERSSVHLISHLPVALPEKPGDFSWTAFTTTRLASGQQKADIGPSSLYVHSITIVKEPSVLLQ